LNSVHMHDNSRISLSAYFDSIVVKIKVALTACNMGSGLVTEATRPAAATQVERNHSLQPLICHHLSVFSRYLLASASSSHEQSEERHLLCFDSWRLINEVYHELSDGQLINGVDLFCKMFVSLLHKNDLSEDGVIVHAFRPHRGSHNYNRAIILRRIVKYLLSILHEDMGTKQQLRALGRTHARIKVDRPEFDVFTLSFLETWILFPGVAITSDIVDAWASLLKFAVDQMCFDKIIFKDHITLTADADGFHEPPAVVMVLNAPEGEQEQGSVVTCSTVEGDTSAMSPI
jgi:hypothetical protein